MQESHVEWSRLDQLLHHLGERTWQVNLANWKKCIMWSYLPSPIWVQAQSWSYWSNLNLTIALPVLICLRQSVYSGFALDKLQPRPQFCKGRVHMLLIIFEIVEDIFKCHSVSKVMVFLLIMLWCTSTHKLKSLCWLIDANDLPVENNLL